MRDSINSEISSAEMLQLANEIKLRKLEGPCLFLLEAHKPLSRVIHAAMIVSEPLLFFISGSRLWKSFRQVLEQPQAVEELIVLLEV